jgi:hypothetical protein
MVKDKKKKKKNNMEKPKSTHNASKNSNPKRNQKTKRK